MSLLAIDNLSIALPKGADRELAVKDVSFTLDKGEVLCIVGESGSGKSMSANALMGMKICLWDHALDLSTTVE